MAITFVTEAEYVDRTAIEDDDLSDWEDFIEDSGGSSVIQGFFQRVPFKAELTSRPSLITLALLSNGPTKDLGINAPDPSGILRSSASSTVAALGELATDSDRASLNSRDMNNQVVDPTSNISRSYAQPITIGNHNSPAQAAIPRQTSGSNSMLAKGLSHSLRRHVLWEHQRQSPTVDRLPKPWRIASVVNPGEVVKHDHSGESTASTGIRPSCPSHIDTRGELRFDTPTGARQWRAKSDPIPSRIQCADTQEPRRTQMGNTKSAGKQINDHMTKTGPKPKCLTDPARIGLSEAPVPSANLWLQRRDRQSTAAKPATATAEGAISVDMTFALTECFKDTIEPNLYYFRARNGEKQLRKTGDIAQPGPECVWGSNIIEKDAKAIRSERLFPIDGSCSWPTPMKK
ncbi:hypothetical protein VFPBJ_11222 [Purpureocillium lilacinum]|uniref:DUF3295 domain-containing protein n=1 Tax=Purpureocillium lilacinum TaxID=33203 RepID=A0A179FF49_PURLI|nr:hypothetical protein VFPBJ_11222 [Purpureocillium lilacinum]